jgi:hypothetical protein
MAQGRASFSKDYAGKFRTKGLTPSGGIGRREQGLHIVGEAMVSPLCQVKATPVAPASPGYHSRPRLQEMDLI